MKIILSIVFSLCLFCGNAQWIGLPNAISPYSGPNSCFQFLTIPNFIMPVSNGKILYSTYCSISPSSGGEIYFQYSDNDLSSMQIKSHIGPNLGCCPHSNIYAYNDSCFSSVISQAGTTWAFYTTNKFTTIYALYSFQYPGMAKATCVTPNLIYSLAQNGTSDSMRVLRSTKAGASLIKKNNYLYNPFTDKLHFINDSTGFTLATFKSNTAKTALLKTTNYGVTWTPVLIDSVNGLTDYHVMQSGIGYTCNKLGDTYYSNDFGNTWSYKGTPTASNYYAIRFMNDSCGYIGGASGSLFKTVNRGANWTFETSNTTQTIERLYTFGNIAYYVDAAKKVFKNSALSIKFFKQTDPVPYSAIPCNSTSVVPTFTFGSNVVSSNLYTITVNTPTCISNFTFATSATSIGFTFPCAGVYTLTGYDGAANFLGTVNYTVVESTVFSPTITALSDTICNGNSTTLSFSNTTSGYTISPFNWSSGQNFTPITVSPNTTTVYSLNGLFTAGTRTCNVSSSKIIVVDPCVGIYENKNNHFKIYPNPVATVLFIEGSDADLVNSVIEITNALGQSVLKTNGRKEINVDTFPAGNYILKLTTTERNYYLKFIKK